MNGPDRKEVQDVLRDTLRKLVAATILVYVVLAGLGVYVYVNGTHQGQQLKEVADSTTAALCTFRADLETRVESSRVFLEENPNGIPGVPVSLLRESIANQERTIRALVTLPCGTG